MQQYATESAADSIISILDQSGEHPVGFPSINKLSNKAKLGLLNRGILFQSPVTKKLISTDKVCFKTTSITDRSTDARNSIVVAYIKEQVVML